MRSFEKTLWAAADQLGANSRLQPNEYADPVLALIFLRFANLRFDLVDKLLKASPPRGGLQPRHYHAKGAFFLAPEARYDYLLNLPGSVVLGKALNQAMVLIEEENQDLKGVLPRGFEKLKDEMLGGMLKSFWESLKDADGDVFGRVYEYFLGEFAKATLQKGGEFYTPASVVRLIVDILEPFHGSVLDPACGSGGMFVQSARFIEEHVRGGSKKISIRAIEKVEQTHKLCRMNLAVHQLSALSQIAFANTYHDDLPFELPGQYDFVMANPPFNQSGVDKTVLKDAKNRYPFGIPSVDSANYLWVQLFYSSLKPDGRAGFVMANSASDARGNELEIRKQILKAGSVDVIVTLASNFFYTVTLPVTLWFFDKGKPDDRKGKVLFIDARHVFRQIDRAHRDFSPDQIEYLANIVRLYRGKPAEKDKGSAKSLSTSFPEGQYRDVAGLCKVATLKEIEAQGWSLNPGRYVGVAEREEEDFDFKEKLEGLNEELEKLNGEARELEMKIAQNVAALLEA